MATVALNGAKNAGLLAVQILSVGDVQLRKKMLDYKEKMNSEVMEKVQKVKDRD